MESRENYYQETIDAYSARNQIIIENLNLVGQYKNILDFGCGVGQPATLLSSSLKGTVPIIGYDIDQDKINLAKEAFKNVKFTSSFEEVYKNGPYDNIINSFVIEESGVEILKDINKLLSKDGKLLLFFYNIKDKNINQFIFNTAAEKEAFKKFGKEEALQQWSQRNSKDYINDVSLAGFKVIKNGEVPKSNNKFGFLIAQK